jgi:hypothetical protein
MPRFEVTKHLEAVYQVDAETPEAALASPWPREDPDAVSILRERAKDLDRPKSAGPRTISDRTLRAGRTFERKFEGTTHQAVFIPGGRVKLDGVEVFATLSKATAAIRPGVSLNSWVWWKEVEPAPKIDKAAEPAVGEPARTLMEPEPTAEPAPLDEAARLDGVDAAPAKAKKGKAS